MGAPPQGEQKGESEASSKMLSKSESKEEEVRLGRTLGLLDGSNVIVGIIVGSGIFVSPKGVLVHAGSVAASLVVWAVSGLTCLVGAMCYAELGTMIPESGGDFAYIRRSFGPFPAFLYLWSALLVIMPAGNAITALTFGYYLLQPFWPECDAPINAVRLVAALIICLLTAVNCYNVRSVARVQDVFTVAKVLALVVVIVAGGVYLGPLGQTENLEEPGINTNWSPGQLALSLYSGLFSYAGWNYLNFVTEELKEPEKNLPRAIYLSMPTVIVVYLLANVAYFAVLTPVEIMSSNAVAVTFAFRLLGSFWWVMPLFVACSTFGSVNGGIFASSRLFFVGARAGHMPRSMALINVRTKTPMPCLVILGLISLAMLTTDSVYDLINYTSFVESLFQLVSVAGLLYLRWKEPELKRPVKVHLFFPIVFLVVCFFLVTLPAFDSPALVGVDLAVLVAGAVVYFVAVSPVFKLGGPRSKLARTVREINYTWNLTVQKLFLAAPEEDEAEEYDK